MTTRSVPAGNSRSACHTIAGARPETSRSVRAMSRSRLMPGKTTTADFIGRCSCDLDAVVLDPGVREQLLRRLLEPDFGCGAVAVGDLDVEHLALADAGDAVDTERF